MYNIVICLSLFCNFCGFHFHMKVEKKNFFFLGGGGGGGGGLRDHKN